MKQTLTKRFVFTLNNNPHNASGGLKKPLKFTGIWENCVQPPPLQCTWYSFQIFRMSVSATGKEKISISVTGFAA